MFKLIKNNNKGFTLVEVIVVAVIVLILAAVAIPLYNGYIRDSRIASVSNAATAIASGLGAAVQTNSADWGPQTTNLAASGAAQNITITAGGAASNQILLPRDMTLAIGNGQVTVTHARATDAVATVRFTE
ncbi:MAG: prepilin-type N-terminal cleavage/methylation domain-containing protein [Chitinispirillales bacterium]|jgi:type IV pilus assembly protein PilA|nr:prepilin-type N-terminal cleavage/methylation domain-containing protein [Chitinispirillales bacterium]